MQLDPHDKSKFVKSPCRSICTLNEKGMCIGCFRWLDEIANWTIMSPLQKQELLKTLKYRVQLPKYFD
jgi:uncharacterized protein